MTTFTPRKKWLAMLLSLIMPGLGQTYCGELLRGICFLVFFIFSPLLLARLAVMLPHGWLLAGCGLALAAALASYLLALWDSRQLAARTEPYQVQSYNRVAFYLASWLVGMTLILATDGYLKKEVVQAYRIVTTSMSPTVLPGDYVLVNKTSYRKEPVKKGDIVIAIYPDDRSKPLIRQIYALPGESLTLKNGSTVTVPHGTVLVRGSGPDVIDSASFGPLDLRDVVGKVSQIYFSRDEQGIRWQRIGRLVNP